MNMFEDILQLRHSVSQVQKSMIGEEDQMVEATLHMSKALALAKVLESSGALQQSDNEVIEGVR